MRIFIFFVLLIFSSTKFFAQHLIRVKGEYSLMVRGDLSISENESLAINQARVVALKKAFGEVLIQGNSTILTSANKDESKSADRQLYVFSSEAIVNGEFVSETSEPKLSKYLDADGQLWIKAEVQGLARSLEHSEVSFSTAFYNCPLESCKTTKFRDGDDFIIKFTAGSSGYLYIFLDNVAQGVTQVVFPNINQELGLVSSHEFMAGESAWLFDGKESNLKTNYQLSAVLSNESSHEIDKVYFIFSERPLRFPDFKSGNRLSTNLVDLGYLKLEDFQRWLHRLRSLNDDIQYTWEYINILTE